MKQSYRIIPVYTGDVSGVCSALFELGGMTVIHDPSGCNSTYNTHDETRWYDSDSLIFISGLSERDALMGNDKKLIRDIVTAAKQLNPRFITLVNSPIPYMTGTDFHAVAALVEKETGIPVLRVATNGMHDYTKGAGDALAALIAPCVREPKGIRPKSLNILGVTPLDFAAAGSAASLRRAVSERGWDIVSCWAMDSSPEDIEKSAEASVNLVVSSLGLAAAQELQKRFGTPYVAGPPVDGFSDLLFEALESAEREKRCAVPYTQRSAEGEGCIHLIGDAVVMGSIAAAITRKCGRPARVVCPLEVWKGLLGETDVHVFGEEGTEQAVQNAESIIADPLYRPVCPANSAFFPLPHEAFSGRIFRKTMPNIAELDVCALIGG